MAPPHTAAARIERAIREAKRSHRWVAVETGIALSTLNRKLNGHVDFYLHEVSAIARVLNKSPMKLLPPEWHNDASTGQQPRRHLAGVAA